MSDFRVAIEARDIDRVIELLSEDVVFRSPAVFGEYHGPAAVAPVLRAVAAVFEDFRYVNEFNAEGGRGEALLFEARVGERRIEGCDFVTWDDDGLVSELVVMVRPLSGLTALVAAIREIVDSVT